VVSVTPVSSKGVIPFFIGCRSEAAHANVVEDAYRTGK